jgi:MFS family permease
MMKADLALSATQFGIVAGVGRGTSGATTMVAGYLGERFANRSGAMLFLSLSIMGISYFLLGIAPDFWWLLLVMLLVGIGPSLYHPPAIASLSRKFPDKRGFAISLHGTGGSIGEMLGPVIVGLLTTETFKVGTLITITYLVAFEWNEVLKISVIPALFFAVLVYLMMRNIPTVETETSSISEYFGDLGVLLKEKSMLGLIFVTALRAMGQSAIMYFLPLYLLAGEDLINPSQGGLGKDTLTVGFYLAGAQVTGIFAQPLMGWISDKYGRKIVLIPAMALLGFLFIALNYVSDGYQLILNVLAMGAFVYSLHTIFIAAAMDVSKGRAQSTVVSLIYGASFLGTVSPIIAGLIVDEFGLKSAFIYSGVVALSATIVLGFIKLPSNEGRQKSPH